MNPKSDVEDFGQCHHFDVSHPVSTFGHEVEILFRAFKRRSSELFSQLFKHSIPYVNIYLVISSHLSNCLVEEIFSGIFAHYSSGYNAHTN